MNADALRKLIEAVEAGEWTLTHWRDFAAVPVGDDDNPGPILANRAYHGSLDAARALHEALLPGWDWTMNGNGQAVLWPPGDIEEQTRGAIETDIEDNPARALLLAILRTKLAEVGYE